MVALDVVLLCCLTLAASAPCIGPVPRGDERDTVVLKNGKQIRCRVVIELDDKVAILVGSREKWIKRDKIKSITSVPRSLGEVFTKFDAAEHKPDKLIEIAELCMKKQLHHEARLFYWSVVLADPNHEVAHQALGHKRAGSGWRVPVEGTWKTLDKAEEVHARWANARTIRSEHFELRTDVGIRLAVRTLLELESFYRHLYDLFQRSLELREILEPIRVHLYKDETQFPRLSGTVDAYFSPEDNILFTFLDDNGDPLTLFRQATHGLIYNFGGSKRSRRSDLPGWLHEAWGDYVEGIIARAKDKHGRVSLDLNRRMKGRIGNLRAEKKLYTLRRILIFKRNDFEASSRQALKYAQSYALFLFMLEAEKGRYQDKFLNYMRDALMGKESPAAFRRVFRRDLNKIEKGYVKVQ